MDLNDDASKFDHIPQELLDEYKKGAGAQVVRRAAEAIDPAVAAAYKERGAKVAKDFSLQIKDAVQSAFNTLIKKSPVDLMELRKALQAGDPAKGEDQSASIIEALKSVAMAKFVAAALRDELRNPGNARSAGALNAGTPDDSAIAIHGELLRDTPPQPGATKQVALTSIVEFAGKQEAQATRWLKAAIRANLTGLPEHDVNAMASELTLATQIAANDTVSDSRGFRNGRF